METDWMWRSMKAWREGWLLLLLGRRKRMRVLLFGLLLLLGKRRIRERRVGESSAERRRMWVVWKGLGPKGSGVCRARSCVPSCVSVEG